MNTTDVINLVQTGGAVVCPGPADAAGADVTTAGERTGPNGTRHGA